MKSTKKADLAKDAEAGVQRILVALDESNQSVAALETAARLAEQLEAELLGMFVEDIELLHLSGLPFAREVGMTSASSREISDESMERSLRARAGRMRANLESIAEKHSIDVSFKVKRGKVLPEVLQASHEVDLVAVGTRGLKIGFRNKLGSTCRGVVEESRCSVLLIQEDIAPGDTVLALFDGSVESEKALKLASELALNKRNRLVVILLANESDLEEQQEHAANILPPSVEANYQQLDLARLDSMADLLKDEDCGVLLIPEQYSRSVKGLEPETLAKLQCPVLLVR